MLTCTNKGCCKFYWDHQFCFVTFENIYDICEKLQDYYNILLHYSQDIGAGKGKYYAVNFPLRDGIDDDSYEQIFNPVRIS